jgi:hypothetical protein
MSFLAPSDLKLSVSSSSSTSLHIFLKLYGSRIFQTSYKRHIAAKLPEAGAGGAANIKDGSGGVPWHSIGTQRDDTIISLLIQYTEDLDREK